MRDPARDLAEAPYLDFFDPALADADPEALFAELRAQSSVVRTPLGASLIRRDQVQATLSDKRFVSAIGLLTRMQGVDSGPLAEMLGTSIITMEGEEHTRLRKLVNRAFTPRAVEPHRPAMRRLVHELVDTFEGAGRCEFVADFADHYPIQVICQVLGVPTEDHHLFAAWGEQISFALSLELAAHRAEIEQAAVALAGYVNELIAERRQRPGGDDLVSALVAANEDGDRLSDGELLSMVGGLLFAGFDTTRNQLGHAMVLFAEHPDQWKALAADPDLADAAVAEVMRYSGAVRGNPRVALEDAEIDGWRIPAGTMVMLSLFSANRDEGHYDDGWRFDIFAEREPHLTFGGGPHYCIGANLARAEMAEALRILAVRLPEVALDGEVVWRPDMGIHGPARLPLRWTTP